MRTASLVGGMLLALASTPLLIRHLGDADFGRYAAVIAVVTIVGGLMDAGISTIALRELAVITDRARARPPDERPARSAARAQPRRRRDRDRLLRARRLRRDARARHAAGRHRRHAGVDAGARRDRAAEPPALRLGIADRARAAARRHRPGDRARARRRGRPVVSGDRDPRRTRRPRADGRARPRHHRPAAGVSSAPLDAAAARHARLRRRDRDQHAVLPRDARDHVDRRDRRRDGLLRGLLPHRRGADRRPGAPARGGVSDHLARALRRQRSLRVRGGPDV